MFSIIDQSIRLLVTFQCFRYFYVFQLILIKDWNCIRINLVLRKKEKRGKDEGTKKTASTSNKVFTRTCGVIYITWLYTIVRVILRSSFNKSWLTNVTVTRHSYYWFFWMFASSKKMFQIYAPNVHCQILFLNLIVACSFTRPEFTYRIDYFFVPLLKNSIKCYE